MNNTINVFNNVSFNSRYLRPAKEFKYIDGNRVLQVEEIPKPIMRALQENRAIQNFIKEGNPKNLWEKFLNLFKRNEYLEVSVNRGKYEGDLDNLTFYFRKALSKKARCGFIVADKDEVMNDIHYTAGERWLQYGLNNDISDKVLAKQVLGIKDIRQILKADVVLNHRY